MFARTLEHNDHVRRYAIRHEENGGWQITTEQDGRVRRHASYTDWHRVEQARLMIDIEIASLEEAGWRERN
ncbi:MAG: hypothetical protein KGN76_12845 [Acidobacteriota bacterium]|nr:hypothetical protein [Acidobacteriota bacterium]